jgi:hypothetical protein
MPASCFVDAAEWYEPPVRPARSRSGSGVKSGPLIPIG